MSQTPNDPNAAELRAAQLRAIDRELLADLYLSKRGFEFLETLIARFGSRFGGSQQEKDAAAYIRDLLQDGGLASAELQGFDALGWDRGETRLSVVAPEPRELDVIALPMSPSGTVEAPLVDLGDGHPQVYEEMHEQMNGAIVMVTTATPRFYHRPMHRLEKITRAKAAGAAAVIWMRGEAGGLPETGSASFGAPAAFPVVSVSYETGQALVRMQKRGEVRLRIESRTACPQTVSYNVVAELPGSDLADEVIVAGAHYDGHDISESAADDGAGTAVLLEAALGLARHPGALRRTVRFVAFAQEELGLHGATAYADQLATQGANVRFMLNLDGAGRGPQGVLTLQGWPESVRWFKQLYGSLFESDVVVGDKIGLYSDMFPFAFHGYPSGTYMSSAPASAGAPRGYGHTYWDSLDKVPPRAIALDAARTARLLLQLATREELPLARKPQSEILHFLKLQGLDEVLRYEGRKIPGEAA